MYKESTPDIGFCGECRYFDQNHNPYEKFRKIEGICLLPGTGIRETFAYSLAEEILKKEGGIKDEEMGVCFSRFCTNPLLHAIRENLDTPIPKVFLKLS